MKTLTRWMEGSVIKLTVLAPEAEGYSSQIHWCYFAVVVEDNVTMLKGS